MVGRGSLVAEDPALAHRITEGFPRVWKPWGPNRDRRGWMEGKSRCPHSCMGRRVRKVGCSRFSGPPQAFSDMPVSLKQAVDFAWNLPSFPPHPPSPAPAAPPLRTFPDPSGPRLLLKDRSVSEVAAPFSAAVTWKKGCLGVPRRGAQCHSGASPSVWACGLCQRPPQLVSSAHLSQEHSSLTLWWPLQTMSQVRGAKWAKEQRQGCA